MSVMFKVTKVGHSMNVCEHIHTMSNFGHFGHFNNNNNNKFIFQVISYKNKKTSDSSSIKHSLT